MAYCQIFYLYRFEPFLAVFSVYYHVLLFPDLSRVLSSTLMVHSRSATHFAVTAWLLALRGIAENAEERKIPVPPLEGAMTKFPSPNPNSRNTFSNRDFIHSVILAPAIYKKFYIKTKFSICILSWQRSFPYILGFTQVAL